MPYPTYYATTKRRYNLGSKIKRRKAWADITNKYLEENSIQDKVDHRSYQRQGKENLLSIFENLICKNADNNNADIEKYIESYQLLKEKNIISINQLKENITDLQDKNYKTTRALKDTEKMIDEKTQLIDQSEKYLKYKDTLQSLYKIKENQTGRFL